MIAVGVVVAVVLGLIVVEAFRRETDVVIVGPSGDMLTVGGGQPVGIRERAGLLTRLRAGEHPIESPSPEDRTSVDVPFFAKRVFVPARKDHCLTVALATGVYTFDGEVPDGPLFEVLESGVDRHAVYPWDGKAVIDPCLLPWSLELTDAARVVYATPCDAVPSENEELNTLLVAAMLSCPGR